MTGCTSEPDTAAATDPLSSWNETPAKQSIVDFVERVTTPDTADFVAEADPIAVFDNDGTLWTEAPVPFQVAFAFDEVKRRAPSEPALAADPMVQAALKGDVATLLAGDRHEGLLRVLALTHTGMTTDEFNDSVEAWMSTARHPRFDRPYDQLTYQPQQELLDYLRDNGFRTYIVSGGGADFMRVWSCRVYGFRPSRWSGRRAPPSSKCATAHRFSSRRWTTCLSMTRPENRRAYTNSSPGARLVCRQQRRRPGDARVHDHRESASQPWCARSSHRRRA